MIEKVIHYIDFDGNEQDEVAHFHLSEAALSRMSISVEGGMEAYLQKIVEEKDTEKILDVFEEIIQKSYGRREGNRFIQKPEMTEAFTQTEAYSELYMELLTDVDAATDFIKGVLPAKLSAKLPDEIPQELPSVVPAEA